MTTNFSHLGDLTNLDYDTLCDILSHLQVDNSREYYRYLCASLPAMARLPSRRDASGRDSGFIEKVFRVVSVLDTPASEDHESYVYAFHVLIRVCASVFRDEIRRLPFHSTCAANLRILQTIRDRFEKPVGVQDAKSVAWPLNAYWDFAGARRKLWAAWLRPHCTSEYALEEDCWRRQNRDLLEYVQKRAYGEIRAKVMLTIGTKLPSELTQIIFEMAMAAEEMPPEVTVYEAVDQKSANREDGNTGHTMLRIRECYRAHLDDGLYIRSEERSGIPIT